MSRARTNAGYRLGVTAVLIALLVVTAPAFASQADNSIRFASEHTLENSDPYFTISMAGEVVGDSVWDTLIYFDAATGAYKGDLALAWRWVDDKTLELDLRRGVHFHDGTEFNADDVVHTLNFVSKPESKALDQNIVRWIARVEKLERYKVRIVTNAPFPAAIAYLAHPRLVIHQDGFYARPRPRGMSDKPIGTGPYRLVEHVLGKHVRLVRNADYFKDSPKSQPGIERVEIRFIPDAQTRVAEAVAGGLDLIANVACDQAEQLRPVTGLQVLSGETMRYAFLAMNTLAGTPVRQLRDVRVRQAIMHAIDRETIVRFLVGENSRVLHVECHPNDFGCVDTGAPHYPYDPKRARELLAEAGHAAGFGLDLYTWWDRSQAEAIVNYLRAVGITARLRFVQGATLVTVRRSGKAAMLFTVSPNGIADVSNSASRYSGLSSDDVNRDPEIGTLLARGDSAMDPNTRKEAYGKALRLIAERAYVLPLYSIPTYYVAAKDLVFKPYPDELPRFYEMSWK